jgi:hypothetical protein
MKNELQLFLTVNNPAVWIFMRKVTKLDVRRM